MARTETSLKRQAATAAALCTLLAGAAGCSTSWPRLEQPGAGFAVTLPASATCGSQRDSTPFGVLAGHYCSADLERALFDRLFPIRLRVVWSDLPANLEAAPSEEVEHLLTRLATDGLPKGATTVRRSAELGGLSAVEFDSTITMNDPFRSTYTLRERLLLRGRKVYRLGVTGVMGPTSERAWQRFLGSFELKADPR